MFWFFFNVVLLLLLFSDINLMPKIGFPIYSNAPAFTNDPGSRQ